MGKVLEWRNVLVILTLAILGICFKPSISNDLGRSDEYIENGGVYVNGQDNISWTARIFVNGKMVSSAVVIADNIVITVAHAFSEGYDLSDYTIVVGWINQEITQNVSIEEVFIPKNYAFSKDRPNTADIAFIRTKSSIKISSPVSLPENHITFDFLEPKIVYLISWGQISINGDLPTTAKIVPLTLHEFNEIDEKCSEDEFICSRVWDHNGFTCTGDSGGALVAFVGDKRILIGVLITGKREICNEDNVENIFTNISTHLKFFHSNFPTYKNKVDAAQYVNLLVTVFSLLIVIILLFK